VGYTTSFSGSVRISPPLNAEEIAFLTKFNETRRMHCQQGPYYVDRGGFMGQDHDLDVLDYNRPPPGQPGLWCKWRPTEDGTKIVWDGGEKFYDSPEWMKYIIAHFLAPGAIAKSELPFLQANHTVSGTIEAQGEESDDRWDLVVQDNRVFTRAYERVARGDLEPV
jgi:hypothetical protein